MACRVPCPWMRLCATGWITKWTLSFRRTRYRLRQAEEEAHILRGLLKALDALDEVIALIRRSPTADEARSGLMEFLQIDEAQAQAILNNAAASSGCFGASEDSGSPR